MILEQNNFAMGGANNDGASVNVDNNSGAGGYNGMGGIEGGDIDLQPQHPHVAVTSASRAEPLQVSLSRGRLWELASKAWII